MAGLRGFAKVLIGLTTCALLIGCGGREARPIGSIGDSKQKKATPIDPAVLRALMKAISDNDADGVASIAASGFDLSSRDDTGLTPLGAAVHLGRVAIVKVLLAHHADIDARQPGGITPLMLAIAADKDEVAFLLLAAGAKVNLQTGQGVTALMLATVTDMAPVVEKLLSRGADPNLEDAAGNTALLGAVLLGKKMALKVLLAKATGLVISASAVTEACNMGDVEAFEALIDKGGDIESRGQGGATCLVLAVWNKRYGLVRRSLARGADANAVDPEGWTPLMTAAAVPDLELVKILLENGAKPGQADKQQRTAASVAASNGNADIAALLSKAAGLPPMKVTPLDRGRDLTKPLPCPFNPAALQGSAQMVVIMPLSWHPADAAKRWGHGLSQFSRVRSSKEVPVEVCRPAGESGYLESLTCDGGEHPFTTSKETQAARAGSVGQGGRCGNLVDLFIIHCPEASYKIYLDMYHCTPLD